MQHYILLSANLNFNINTGFEEYARQAYLPYQ